MDLFEEIMEVLVIIFEEDFESFEEDSGYEIYY